MAQQKCPKCLKDIDRHIEINSGELIEPSIGDINVCFGCGSIFLFDTELKLVDLDENDSDFLSASMTRDIMMYYKEKTDYKRDDDCTLFKKILAKKGLLEDG